MIGKANAEIFGSIAFLYHFSFENLIIPSTLHSAMPTEIPHSSLEKLEFTPSPEDARNIIADLHSQITRVDGTIKSGVLKLMHTTPGKPKEMSFERKSWWQFFARRSSKMDVTATYLKKLLSQAFGQNLDTEEKKVAFERISKDFDTYLAKRSNRIGTRTLAEFITRFQNELPIGRHQVSKDGTLLHEFQQWKVTPSANLEKKWQKDLNANIKNDFAESHIPITDDEAEGFSREIIGALTEYGHKCSELEPENGPGETGRYTFGGSDTAIGYSLNLCLPHPLLPTGPDATPDRGECLAATLGGVPRLLRPTFYLVRSTNETTGGLYKVPAHRLENFLQHSRGMVSLVGTITPPPKGWPIIIIKGHHRSELKPIQDIAKQGIDTLLNFSKRNIVHGNLNERTILYDDESRQTTIATTNSLVKMHAPDGQEPSITTKAPRTAGFSHPSILRGKPHGCEADLFSLTAILLDSRFPEMKNILHARNSPRNPIKVNEDWEKPGGKYLENLVNAENANASEIRAALNASDPGEDAHFLDFAKQAIDASFTTGEKYQAKLEELLKHPFLAQ